MNLTYILLVIIFVLIIILFVLTNHITSLIKQNKKLKFDYQSKNVKHGKSFEHFVPFTPEFEQIADKNNFTFIGMPIDGIAFEEDAIKFIEIKTGSSQLSQKQKRVKELIQNKQVEWHELRF